MPGGKLRRPRLAADCDLEMLDELPADLDDLVALVLPGLGEGVSTSRKEGRLWRGTGGK